MKNKIIIYLILFSLVQIGLLHGEESSSIANHCSKILGIDSNDFSVQKFVGGVSNRVYLLTTSSGDQFVAKLFTQKSLDEVESVEQFVSQLRQIGFAIPETVAITLFQDSIPLHISKFQSGRYISDERLEEAAGLMAKLHIKGSALLSPPNERYKGDEHFKNLFEKCSEWALTNELEEIYEQLDLSYLSEIPTGLIHGDFSYTNLIINPENELVLLDFEHICTSYLLTDLVRCHMFYGFDENGSLLEEKVKAFASIYHAVRPLTTTEVDNFYSHMKLMMIDTALGIYYNLHIARDLPEDVIQCEENKALAPELLVKKIQNLKSKKNLVFENDTDAKTPIVFFGMSGAGKTTMIRGLVSQRPDLFYVPVFTCTRSPRPDDEISQFEYVTIDNFLHLEEENAFLFTMHEGNGYYGYRKSSLTDSSRHPLLNCSPRGIDNINFKAIFVLVQGDCEKGLLNRNNPVDLEQRTLINEKFFKNFYSQDWFLQKMDIIHFNEWSKIQESTWSLGEKILQKISAEENELSNKAA